MNENSSALAVDTNLSCAREFRIDPQYRRCCIYLVIGGWVILGTMFVVASQLGQPAEPARIAFGAVMFGVAPLLLWLYVATCRLRLDEWGLSRRQLWFWSCWSWESFSAGEVSYFARKGILSRSRGRIWSRWILLGFFPKAENEFLLAALKRVIPPEKWREGERLDLPAEEVTEAVVGLVLTRKLHLDRQGCTLEWQGDQLIRWEHITQFRIAKSQQKDMNVFRLDIRFQDRPPLGGHLNSVSFNGKTVGSLARGDETWHERLQEIVPSRCWRYFRTSGELQSIEEGEFRIAEARKQLKLFKFFWAAAAILTPLAAWNFVPGMIGLWNNPFFPLGWKVVALVCGFLAMIQPSVLIGSLAYYMARRVRESIAEVQREMERLPRGDSIVPLRAA